MEIELTPEKIIEYGKKWQNIVLSGLDPDEIMTRFSIKDRLRGLAPEDRLKGLAPEEIEKYLKQLKKKACG